MRILIVSPFSWRRDLGAARADMELAEELTRLGHEVTKFSLEDAGLDSAHRPILPYNPYPFSLALGRFLRRTSRTFDVLRTLQGHLPLGRGHLSPGCVTVVRSAGLVHLYQEWELRTGGNFQWASRPGIRAKVNRHRDRLGMGVMEWATNRSFDMADLIIARNDAERTFLESNPRWCPKVVAVPSAISQAAFDALAHRPLPRAGTASPTIAFIGSWDRRKGAADFPELTARIWGACPEARFLLLGTGVSEALVRTDLGRPSDDRLQVVERFDPPDLPRLLAGASVGVFPTYIEGWGLAAVELLAAGIPVVSYDVPGPAHILGPLDRDLLVPPGDIEAMTERVLGLLSSTGDEMLSRAEACRARAACFTWTRVTPLELEAYAALLAERSKGAERSGTQSTPARGDDVSQRDGTYSRLQ